MHPILSIIDEEKDSNGGAIKLTSEDETNVSTDDSLVSHYLPVNLM